MSTPTGLPEFVANVEVVGDGYLAAAFRRRVTARTPAVDDPDVDGCRVIAAMFGRRDLRSASDAQRLVDSYRMIVTQAAQSNVPTVVLLPGSSKGPTLRYRTIAPLEPKSPATSEGVGHGLRT